MKRGSPLTRYAALVSRTPLARVSKPSAGKPKSRKPTGPDDETTLAVLRRDDIRCLRCGDKVNGTRGVHWSLHHRRPRRMGGSRRPDTNSPANLATLCGSGTTGCHGEVESRRAEAVADGWILHDHDTPAAVPLLIYRERWVYLTDGGGISEHPPVTGEDA